MWAEILHHLTLHFPIVLTMVLAATGLYARRSEQGEALLPLMRYGGLITLALTTVATVSGLIAGGFTGGEEALQHHRYLGILSFVVIAAAALSFEFGLRHQNRDLRTFGTYLWWIAVFAVIGAGFWGGLGAHGDLTPF